MDSRWLTGSHRALVVVLVLLALPHLSPADEGKPAAAGETPLKADPPWLLPHVIERVPVLKHDAAGRLPIICITPFRMAVDDKSFEEGRPLPPEMIRALKARGLTQWIPPREKYIPFAKALQAEGAGVIVMEDGAFNGPGGEDPSGRAVDEWLHVLPKDYKGLPRPGQQPRFPCPLVLEGWRQKADSYRAFFGKLKKEGVDVQGAWLDLEIEPYAGKAEWDEAKHCSRCRSDFPRGVLDDFDAYHGFITRWRTQLFSTYIVAPILESFPRCVVTNWEEVISTSDIPTPSWASVHNILPDSIGMFTATNPVSYGNTAWKQYHWKKEWNWPLDALHMDRVYTFVMLNQFSKNEANARREAPEKKCVPWVDRFCADDRDPGIPILSRGRYGEILRHLWLRGADAMQVFNPVWFENDPVRTPIVVEEIEDVVSVYDEMLAYREFLDDGKTMGLAVPLPTDDGPIWSGRRVGDRAVIRGFTMSGKTVKARLTPFDQGGEVEVECPPEGATYLLTCKGGKVMLERTPH